MKRLKEGGGICIQQLRLPVLEMHAERIRIAQPVNHVSKASNCIGLDKVREISTRIDVLTGWLTENASYCETEQKHLVGGTAERAYWHYGYVCALRDLLSNFTVSSPR